MIVANIMVNGNFKLNYSGKNTEMDDKNKSECDLHTLGKFRNSIASISKSIEFEKFGKIRQVNLDTPDLLYQSFFNRFLSENFDKYKNSSYLEVYKNTYGDKPNCRIIADIEGTSVKLTNYFNKSASAYVWQHTEPKYIPDILNHCQKLIDRIISMEEDQKNPETLTEEIGQLHWWLSHACPYERGSASISEAICMALFKTHGYEASYTSMPDCEALISPSEKDYARNYSSFTKVTPLMPKSVLANKENISNDAQMDMESSSTQFKK